MVIYFKMYFILQELCELIAKEVLQTQTHKSPMSFLDIGCGSGAIGVYLLKHLPHVCKGYLIQV